MQANKNLPHNLSPGNEPIITTQRAAEIIKSWHIDPISRWATEQRARQFITPSPTYFSTNHTLAQRFEIRVKQRLESLGHVVAKTGHKAKYDLLVDNCLTIEVKGSNWHTQGRYGRYQANIRNHITDVLIFVAHNGAVLTQKTICETGHDGNRQRHLRIGYERFMCGFGVFIGIKKPLAATTRPAERVLKGHKVDYRQLSRYRCNYTTRREGVERRCANHKPVAAARAATTRPAERVLKDRLKDWLLVV